MLPRRVIFAITLLIAVLDTQRGEGGPIPWSYQWSAQPTVVDADPLGPDHTAAGGIKLTPGAIAITGGNPGVAEGNSSIIAVNLNAFIFSSRDGKPYSFTNSPFHLGVTLTDIDSGKSWTPHFSGFFDGTFTYSTLDLQRHFTSATQQSQIVGHNRYTVSLTSYTPPQPPSEGGAGNISAYVSVQPVSAPEPSALILAGSGLAAAAFSGLRRRALP